MDAFDVVSQLLPEEKGNRVQRLVNSSMLYQVRFISEEHHYVRAPGERQ